MVGLIWTELPTPHPVIEPVSDIAPGTEFFDAETGARNGLIRRKYAEQRPLILEKLADMSLRSRRYRDSLSHYTT